MERIATFYPAPPYDFLRTIRGARYYTTLGRVRGGAYWRALRAGDGLALVRLSGGGTTDAPVIEADLMAAQGNVDVAALGETLRRMLNPHLNLAPFYALAQATPALWRVVEPLYGLHIFQTETLFEALAVTVIEQQIALSAAQKAERWLVEWAGDCLTYNSEPYFVFPTPERIAAASLEDLTPLKITFRRMQVLIDVAQSTSLEPLRDLPPEGVYEALMALKGVGHWTAAWTMNRGLGRLVYVGSADVALRAAAHHYFLGQPGRLTAAETDAAFAGFGDHAGLAAYYTLMKWGMERYPRDDT